MEQEMKQENFPEQAPKQQQGISTAAGILILALIAAAIGVGIWYFYIYQPNQESATTPTPTQTPTATTDETADWKTLTLEFSKGTLKYPPTSWTIEKDTNSATSDSTTYPIGYLINQDKETKESAGSIGEYDLTSWLTGPKEEGYTLPNTDRQKSVELLKKIYNDQEIIPENQTELTKYSLEFFPYNAKTAVNWKYLESKDKESRGFSCLNITGQDINIFPIYYATLYNPDKKVVVSITYTVPQTSKEVKDTNDKITESNFLQLQNEFRDLIESSKRSNLSFGSLLDTVDQAIKTLSFSKI